MIYFAQLPTTGAMLESVEALELPAGTAITFTGQDLYGADFDVWLDLKTACELVKRLALVIDQELHKEGGDE